MWRHLVVTADGNQLRLYEDGRLASPTRYGLLTGRYDWRTDQKHGVLNTTDPLHIETSRSTIASLLKSTGYRAAAIGKWHLGYGAEKHDFTQPLTPGPLDIGFDYHFAVPQNHGDASGVYVRNRGVVGLRSDRTVPAGTSPYGREYMGIDAPQRIDENVMDELTTEAVEWLESQRDDAPFFLYFAPVAIHFPYTPSDMTKGQSGTGLYGDWIHELDLSVGRILDALDRMNMADDTLVVFTSDNGGVLMAEGDRPEAVAYRAGLRCNGDWRGRKHSIYEGGFRVPFIVRWPGHAPASTTCDETISLVDMYATIAALLEASLSTADNIYSCKFVRDGGLGKVHTILVMNYAGAQPVRGLEPQTIPDGMDWNRFCAQAPLLDYHENLHRKWRRYDAFTGGPICDRGAHALDMVHLAMGWDNIAPTRIAPTTPADNYWERGVRLYYPDGTVVRLESKECPAFGGIFVGEKGKMEINRGRFACNPTDLLPPFEGPDTENHVAN